MRAGTRPPKELWDELAELRLDGYPPLEDPVNYRSQPGFPSGGSSSPPRQEKVTVPSDIGFAPLEQLDESLALLTPCLIPASVNNRELKREAVPSDPFEDCGRNLVRYFKRVRHVPYVSSVGYTATHEAFVDAADVIVMVVCEPWQSPKEAIERQMEFVAKVWDYVVSKRPDKIEDILLVFFGNAKYHDMLRSLSFRRQILMPYQIPKAIAWFIYCSRVDPHSEDRKPSRIFHTHTTEAPGDYMKPHPTVVYGERYNQAIPDKTDALLTHRPFPHSTTFSTSVDFGGDQSDDDRSYSDSEGCSPDSGEHSNRGRAEVVAHQAYQVNQAAHTQQTPQTDRDQANGPHEDQANQVTQLYQDQAFSPRNYQQ